MNNKKKKGFTLIELLATIAIIGTIMGIATIVYTTIIKNSENESTKISKSNILSSARVYVEENKDKIAWNPIPDDKTEEYIDRITQNQKYTCVSVNELKNQGLIEKKTNTTENYVLVWKSENNTLIQEDFDEGLCSNEDNIVEIPTSDEYCYNLTYDKDSEQTLLKKLNDKIKFTDESGVENENIKQKNAGIYTITAVPTDDRYWTDGTKDNKYINCKINKAIPTLTTDPSSIVSPTIDDHDIVLTSDVTGTVTLKSSNTEYYIPKQENNEITEENINNPSNPKKITVTIPSTRDTEGSITITLTPNDIINYYTTSYVLEIGKPAKGTAEIPECVDELIYNGEEKTLINPESYDSTKIYLYNYTGTELGNHEIIAKLKAGYKWPDDTTTDKTITCEIKAPSFNVIYDPNGGKGTTILKDTIIYGKPFTPTTKKYTRDYYNFKYWSSTSDNKTAEKWNTETPYMKLQDLTLYAIWEPYTYTIKYHSNNGVTPETIESDPVTYNSTYKLKNNNFKKIDNTTVNNAEYTFIGWNTKPDGTGTTYNPNQNILINENLNKSLETNGAEINLYAIWREPVYALYNVNISENEINLDSYKNNFKENWDTLSNAVKNAKSGWTIVALKDNESNDVIIDKDLTLNTNGRTINFTGSAGLTNTKTLKINGNGRLINNTGEVTVQNKNAGKLTLNNITIENNQGNALYNASSESVNITSSTIKSVGGDAIREAGSGTLRIDNGTAAKPTTINASAKSANSESGHAIYSTGSGTIIIGFENIDISASNNTTMYNGENSKLYLTTVTTANQNTDCNMSIVNLNKNIITNLGITYLGYQEKLGSLEKQKEYVLDKDEEYFKHTCLAAREDYVIVNGSNLLYDKGDYTARTDFNAGVRTYRDKIDENGNTNFKTNLNYATMYIRGGKIYYNQAEEHTGFTETRDAKRFGQNLNGTPLRSNWITYTYYDDTNKNTVPQTINIKGTVFNYVRYSYLASWNNTGSSNPNTNGNNNFNINSNGTLSINSSNSNSTIDINSTTKITSQGYVYENGILVGKLEEFEIKGDKDYEIK